MFQIKTKNVTSLLLGIILVSCLFASVASAATLTTITVKEKAGVSTSNYPLTFGHVFKKGDVTGNVYLSNYPTQTDVKTTYSDGSIRFAVISALVPMAANSDTVLNVNTTGTAASTTAMTKTEILVTDIGATIDLTGLSGSGYSGNLQADLRATIIAASSLDYWLEGGVCTEILIDQRLNNSLNATWEVRFYPGTSYIRISHVIENVEANYRGSINYAVEIKQGNASPISVYTKANFQHNYQARWRKVLWLGTEPPEVEIHYDTDYLISTGMIPSYDTSLTVPESSIASKYSEWNGTDTDIMGDGLQDNSFASGVEGSLLQKYTAQYLLSWDNRLREVVLGMGEVTASCPIHYREWDNTKSFYGHIISVDDRPRIRVREGKTEDLPAPIGTLSSQWEVDQAHQWSYNYIPYLVTGERWFLDELYYWSSFNMNYQNPDYRGEEDGIIPDSAQVRGVAWAYRTMTQTAAIAPNADIEKAYFEDKIANNIARFITESTKYPLRFIYLRNDSISGLDASVTVGLSGWMQDFLLLAISNGSDLGYDASTVLSEFSKFVINRFTNPDFNWYNGASYRFPGATVAGTVSTWSQASSLFSSQPTSFDPVGYAYSYRHKALAALSQVTDQTGGQTAYDWLKTNFTAGTPPLDEQFADDPTWALVPRDGFTPPAGNGSQPLPPLNLRNE